MTDRAPLPLSHSDASVVRPAPGGNRAARNGRTVGLIACGLTLLMIALFPATNLSSDISTALMVVLVAVFLVGPLALILGVIAIIVSGAGLRRANVHGGRGAAVGGLILGIISVLAPVAFIAALAPAFFIAGHS